LGHAELVTRNPWPQRGAIWRRLPRMASRSPRSSRFRRSSRLWPFKFA
jgi:hypothetical protein